MCQLKGLEPIKVIEALWNNAIGTPNHPQNELAYVLTLTKDFPEAEVTKKLKTGVTYFEYVSSRVLKISLQNFNPYSYNQNHGEGRAEKVIKRLREIGFVGLLPETIEEELEKKAAQQKFDKATTDLEKCQILDSVFKTSGGSSFADIYNDLTKRLQDARKNN